MINLSHVLAGFLLFGVSFFLILLVLVQRGRGGGLTGALGGMGGQSAFGAKAGDLFTRITVVTASIWIVLCMLTISLLNPPVRPVDDSAAAVGAGANVIAGEGDEIAGSTSTDGTGTDDGDGNADSDTDADKTKEEPAKPIGPEEVPDGG